MQHPFINTHSKLSRSLLLVALTLISVTSWGMDAVRLNALKVAYIYNFTKFIEWQHKPADQFNICLNTENKELINAFSKIEKKGYRITVINDFKNEPSEWKACQIVYIENPLRLSTNNIEHHANTLLISEVKNENAQIYFILINNKLRFNIGKNRAEEAGLSISSKLLRLAHEVY